MNASRTAVSPPRGTARDRLLDAAVQLVRVQGFGATSVDDLCAAAGVSKGAFFHHFATKDALGIAAAEHWSAHAAGLFDDAPYRSDPDPVARVLAYVDHRLALIEGCPADFTCYAGTTVQEVHDRSPALRDACAASIFGHADSLAGDFDAAIAARGVTGTSGQSLARHVQAVLQGGFILSKADNSPAPAREAIGHLRRYLQQLFGDA
jgi:TetR/AcrR family transcriptional repressor of nem operon